MMTLCLLLSACGGEGAEERNADELALAIRAEHIRSAEPGEANALPCRVERTAEDVSALLVLLRPRGAAEDDALWMAVAKDQRANFPEQKEIWAALPPERLMLLEE